MFILKAEKDCAEKHVRDVERRELLADSKAQQAKLEENMVILKSEKDCAEKHVRDVERREESLLKEKYDLLESSTEERAQKEEEIVSSMIK